jgi:predicted membrane protein
MENQNVNGRNLTGILLIGLGLYFFFDQFGFIRLPFSLWPVLIITLGLFLMFVKKKFTGGALVVALGGIFLFSEIFNVDGFAVLWPLMIIAVGVSVLFRPRGNYMQAHTGTVNQDSINETAVFSGLDLKVVSDNFIGGKIETVFGGFKLDLTQAKIAEGAEIKIESVFGGGEFIVAKDVRVEFSGSAVFGGWENKTIPAGKDVAVLKVNTSAVFGGVTAKNG